MPKTTAGRMRKHRQNKVNNDPEFKQKESKRIPDLQRQQHASMSEEELSTLWEKNRLEVLAWRAKNKAKEVLKVTPVTKNWFKTPQGFGKAMKRLKCQMPKSPSKKLATVKSLVKEMGLELNTESKAHKTGKNKGLSKEIKDKAINSYYCSTAPALKDEMTVWTEAGKTKMRIYYLTMYLREVFAMFKAENQDCEIWFFLFVSVRPKNVLLLKNQPLDQCKCSIHENSYLLLNALGVNIDKISFWQIVLCESEDYTSGCWKEKCNNCCNGKAIPFPNIISNRIISYKEWGYNDQKRVTLKTLEYPFGEIKRHFVNSFPSFKSMYG